MNKPIQSVSDTPTSQLGLTTNHTYFVSEHFNIAAGMRERVGNFLARLGDKNPCLVMDLASVEAAYNGFRQALPQSDIFYAVKANPAPEVLASLAQQGASFDVASPAEIDYVMAVGVEAHRISYGNTIKKERDIAYAYTKGVRLFAVDCHDEVEKIARVAPGSRVLCRLLVDNQGAEWPLSKKFGCTPSMAMDVLRHAKKLGLNPEGLSFHVGSQQPQVSAWDSPIALSAHIFECLKEDGIKLSLLNLGGGFPAHYGRDIPSLPDYARAINKALTNYFNPEDMPRTAIEPGRGMVGNAGILRSEVVLVSRKSEEDPVRWVYLDVGKFTGLAETMDETIRYKLTTAKDHEDKTPCIIAGPTCDSVDVLYEKNLYPMPVSLKAGDVVWIESAGAYTTAYAADCFNGFTPPATYCIQKPKAFG